MLYIFFFSQFIYLSCLYHPSWFSYSNNICLEVQIMTLIVACLSRNLKVHLPCLHHLSTAPYLEPKESSPQTISLLRKPTLILYRSTSRGWFTGKLLKLKFQGPSLARAPSKAVGGTLNKYPLSHLFFFGGGRCGTVVKVLCYKSVGRWFEPSWCHWNFSLT